jgi:multicomponent Na+:H+ antiporter subunit G
MTAVAAVVLVCAGLFFHLVAVLGILRLPDFFTRVHAVGKGDTLGIGLVVLGLAVHEGWTLATAKMILIIAFYFLANPTAAHALGRAALKTGLAPWTREGQS